MKKIDLIKSNQAIEDTKKLVSKSDLDPFTFLSMALELNMKLAQPPIDTSWMLTEDQFKGFKPVPSPSGQTRFWLCVSRETKFDPSKKYDPPEGYEWALSEMWNTSTVLSQGSEFNYYNLGGWSNYSFRGAERYHFIFKDSPTNTKYVHSGHYPTSPYANQTGWAVTTIDRFAGIVAIKKDSWDNERKQFKY